MTLATIKLQIENAWPPGIQAESTSVISVWKTIDGFFAYKSVSATAGDSFVSVMICTFQQGYCVAVLFAMVLLQRMLRSPRQIINWSIVTAWRKCTWVSRVGYTCQSSNSNVL